jgi:viroplasmin and RNaseH domain-containing protein
MAKWLLLYPEDGYNEATYEEFATEEAAKKALKEKFDSDEELDDLLIVKVLTTYKIDTTPRFIEVNKKA